MEISWFFYYQFFGIVLKNFFETIIVVDVLPSSEKAFVQNCTSQEYIDQINAYLQTTMQF